MRIAIASSFTAEPIQRSLSYWSKKLSLDFNVQFAPYDQVFQQLLDPNGLFSTNADGVNVILHRAEDLAGEGADELVRTIKEAAGRITAPVLLVFCPSSPGSSYEAIEARIAAALSGVTSVYVVTSSTLSTAYRVEGVHDALAKAQGNIPYTLQFFTALGTMIARRVVALRSPPYKVIVLDCDNTLWTGVCGEVGAQGVGLEASRLGLQSFMAALNEAGMLLCLCSKNNPKDVWDVFENRSQMVLKRAHLAAAKINWLPKSQNLHELARELNVGLDSLVFVDDSPMECSEVAASCPEVLTLCLPTDPAQTDIFLRHVWAFDRLKVTKEDKGRTLAYQREVQREEFRQASITYSEFISKLDLQLAVKPLEPSQLGRASQLTQRTNQFNCSTVRRSEGELEQAAREGAQILTVDVTDRFGEYGTVGLMVLKSIGRALQIDTFLLSCRALGRGVEHQMLAAAGRAAVGLGLAEVEIVYRPTAKNEPARQFLTGLVATAQEAAGATIFRVSAAAAASYTYQPPASAPPTLKDPPAASSRASSGAKERVLVLAEIARALRDPALILKASGQVAGEGDAGTLDMLCREWAALLKHECINADEDLFELGADSVMMVLLSSRISELLKIEVPATLFFDAPTLSQQAIAIDELLKDGR